MAGSHLEFRHYFSDHPVEHCPYAGLSTIGVLTPATNYGHSRLIRIDPERNQIEIAALPLAGFGLTMFGGGLINAFNPLNHGRVSAVWVR